MEFVFSFNLYIRDCSFAFTKRKLIIFYYLKFIFGRQLFDYFYFFLLVKYNHDPNHAIHEDNPDQLLRDNLLDYRIIT